MSEENVEVVQRAFEIFNRYRDSERTSDDRDRAFAAFTDIATPDFKYIEPTEWPGAGIYNGLTEYREVLEGFFEALNQMTVEIEEIFETGNRVVVFVRWRARGTASGAEWEMRPGQVFTVRDGKIAKQEVYLDRADALKAAGLSE